MATKSFYKDFKILNKEELQSLIEAIDKSEKQDVKIKPINIGKQLRRSRKLLKKRFTH